jgi:hypothetical protein
MSSYHGQTAQFIAAAAQNMPVISRELMQWWIENPLELQGILARLCKKPSPRCDVWKTIKLGTGLKSADDFRQAFKASGMKLGDWASDVLGKPEFVVSDKETELDLVVVTVKNLGFKNGATREKIYARAKELGLDLCPPEVGPQLRLQYQNQPNGEWILIGMDPIRYSDGYLHVFHVEHDDSELWLYSDYDRPGCVWDAGDRFAFVRSRK